MTRPDPQLRREVPRVLLLADGAAVPEGRTVAAVVAVALGAGVDGVVVRERHLRPADRENLGRQVRVAAQVARSHAALLWAAPMPGDASVAPAQPQDDALGPTAGVHLRADDPFPGCRPPGLVGRSCHTADQLRRAADEGCDYVTLSPVGRSRSKPGYGPALGPGGMRELLEHAAYLTPQSPRVLALGGVEPGSARQWLGAGAHGVAVMAAVMGADDPAAAAAELVAEVMGSVPTP
ncbi:MAG TPA: thiamine phosphate synthase [Dermatophilaceae bacterium]|nr:thiamine phosphate synthase [Dermatophilaceae bacterium]